MTRPRPSRAPWTGLASRFALRRRAGSSPESAPEADEETQQRPLQDDRHHRHDGERRIAPRRQVEDVWPQLGTSARRSVDAVECAAQGVGYA